MMMKTRRPIFLLLLTALIFSLTEPVSTTDHTSSTSSVSSSSVPTSSTSSSSVSSSSVSSSPSESSTSQSLNIVDTTTTSSFSSSTTSESNSAISTTSTTSESNSGTTSSSATTSESNSAISTTFSTLTLSLSSTFPPTESPQSTSESSIPSQEDDSTSISSSDSSSSIDARVSPHLAATSTTTVFTSQVRTSTSTEIRSSQAAVSGNRSGSSSQDSFTQARPVNNVNIAVQSTGVDGSSQVFPAPAVTQLSSGGETLATIAAGTQGASDGGNAVQSGEEKVGSTTTADDSVSITYTQSYTSSGFTTMDSHFPPLPQPIVPISATKAGNKTKWIILAAIFGALLLLILSILGLVYYRQRQGRLRATAVTPYGSTDLEHFGERALLKTGRGIVVLPSRWSVETGDRVPGRVENDVGWPRPSVSSNSTSATTPGRVLRVHILNSESASGHSGPPSYTFDVPPNYELQDSVVFYAQ